MPSEDQHHLPPGERWRETEAEVEAQAAAEPDDPITHAEEVETEVMEEVAEEEEAEQEDRAGG